MEAFPLRIQERVQHLPPRTAVEHEGQSHYWCDWYENSIHCQMFRVDSEDSQESNSSNNAAEDKKEDDKGWQATGLFPFLFACKTENGFTNYLHTKYLEDHKCDSHGIWISNTQFMFSQEYSSHPHPLHRLTEEEEEGRPTLRIFSLEYSKEPGRQKAKLSLTGIRESRDHFSHRCFSTYTGQPVVICEQKPWGKGGIKCYLGI